MDSSLSLKVGILLARPSSHESAARAHDYATTALQAGHDVYLYLIDEGVENLHSPLYQQLARSGAKVFACAYGCQQHHVSTANLDPSISLSGLVVLSNIIDACEPFVSFT